MNYTLEKNWDTYVVSRAQTQEGSDVFTLSKVNVKNYKWYMNISTRWDRQNVLSYNKIPETKMQKASEILKAIKYNFTIITITL